MFLLYSSIGVQNSTLEKYPVYRRHAVREKKKKRIAPQSAAADGAGRKAAKAQRIGNYSFALACRRQAQQSLFQLYFYSISLFISRSAAEFISTLFPLYFFLFHEAQRSLLLFYFHCISSSVLCTRYLVHVSTQLTVVCRPSTVNHFFSEQSMAQLLKIQLHLKKANY